MYLLHACSPSATYTDFFPVGLHFTLATHQRSNGPRECHVNHVTLNALNQSNLPVGRDDEAIIEKSPTHKVYVSVRYHMHIRRLSVPRSNFEPHGAFVP